MFYHKKIAIYALFSTQSESFIYIYPSDKNHMLTQVLKYPVQMSFLSGLDLDNPNCHLRVPYHEAILLYEKAPSFFYCGKQDNTLTVANMTLNIPVNHKLFLFGKNSLALLIHTKIEIRAIHSDEIIFHRNLPYVAILTGEKDFSFAIKKSKKLGKELAEYEIEQLLISSPFFKEALIYDKLMPFAKEIEYKRSRAQKDATFIYSYLDLKKDMLTLQKKAIELGLQANFVDNLFRDPKIKLHDGVLLWYYRDFKDFMYQWTLINVVLFIFLIFLRLTKKKLVFERLNKLNNKLSRSVILSSVNGWVFLQKPAFMNIKYWILPGFFFLICFIWILFDDS